MYQSDFVLESSQMLVAFFLHPDVKVLELIDKLLAFDLLLGVRHLLSSFGFHEAPKYKL